MAPHNRAGPVADTSLLCQAKARADLTSRALCVLLAAAGQRALRECPKSIPLLCCSPRFTSQGSHSPISICQRAAVAAQKGLHLLPCTGSAAGFGTRLVTQDLQRQPGDMKHITHTQLPHPSPWVCCCLAVSYSTLLPLTPAVRAPTKPAFSCHGERGTGCKQASGSGNW